MALVDRAEARHLLDEAKQDVKTRFSMYQYLAARPTAPETAANGHAKAALQAQDPAAIGPIVTPVSTRPSTS